MQEIITSKTGGRPYANIIKVGGIVVKFLCKTVRLKSVSAIARARRVQVIGRAAEPAAQDTRESRSTLRDAPVILAASLGLWAAIWQAVSSPAAARLR